MNLSNDSRSKLCACLLGTSALCIWKPAFAQSMKHAASAAGHIEVVIVTAEKRTENVQTVPMTVTPISGSTLDRMHIKTLQDLNGTVPNLQITSNSGVGTAAGVVIRGIGEVNNPTPYAGKEVSIVVDGVEQATNQLGLLAMYDLQRIEVLSGPQGTLFGANTTGGVINIVTRQPTGHYDAYGTATFGNYGTQDLMGAVDVPITNELAAKVSVYHATSDGFYTNLYNGQSLGGKNDNVVRAYLKWTPSANFNATWETQFDDMKIADTYLQNLAMPGEVFYRPATPTNFTIYDNIPGSNVVSTASQTLTANWRSGIGNWTSISNFQNYKTTGNLDVAGIKGYYLDQFGRDKGWQASEELRDAFRVGRQISSMIGLFAQTWMDKNSGVSAVPFASPDLVTLGITNERSTDLSAFTQNYWNITDRLRLQAGLRFSWDHETLYESALNYIQPAGTTPLLLARNIIGAAQLPYTPGNAPNQGSSSWTNLGGKIGLDYQLTDNDMIYAFYARGFKSGGFNGRVTVASAIGPYNPEYVDSYETGFKTQWLNNRLQLNGSLFYNNWTNMQVQQSNYTGPTIASVILNAGQATTEGIDLAAEYIPVDGLRLSGNVGYLNSHYDKFLSSDNPLCPPLPTAQPAGCALSYAGRALPYSPNWTYSLDGSYTFNVWRGISTAELQYTYTGSRWGNYTQAPSEHLGSVGLVNANVSWGPSHAKWSIELWGRNLLDRTYVATALDVPPLFTEGTLGNPREYGVDLKVRL